jgi:hypothetical protein
MFHTKFRLLVLLLALSSVASVSAAELVREFRGERSMETAEFEVQAPWLIDWWVNSDYPEGMGIEIALIDARRGTHEGRVVETRSPGNGVRLINESGTYRFKIDAALTRWNLKVQQLTRAEAELYTAKGAESGR